MRWSPTLLLLAASCVSAPRPPPPVTYALGEGRTTYRDYRVEAGEGLCDAEPEWLMDELSGVNTLLERFLRQTEGNASEWNTQQLALIEEASKTLPKVLDAHAHNLTELQDCSFAEEKAFPALGESGLEYIENARLRMKQAKATGKVEYAQQVRAVEEKKAEQPIKQVSAQEATCPRKMKISAKPELYYAYQDESDAMFYYFCDGVKGSAVGGGAPKIHIPEGLSAKEKKLLKFFTPAYVRAIKAHPPSAISKVPPVPDPPSIISEKR